MTNRYMVGAGVALAVAFGGAQAQAQLMAMPGGPGAFYFGGEGGWTDLEDQTDTFTGAPLVPTPPGSIHVNRHFNDGFNVGARAGVQWGPWRLEEEYSYHSNGNISGSFVFPKPVGTVSGPLSGDRNSHAIMTNLIYDFNFGWPITPHIGFGLGAIDIVDTISFKGGTATTGVGPIALPATSLVHADDWEFGYQAIAGIEYNFNPTIALDVDYRYLASTSASFVAHANPAIVGAAAPPQHWTTDYSTHNVTASLIVRFGAPPPPPPAVAPPAAPAAAPPPPRNVYLVFFDWDKYNITPEGMAIIRQAANQFHAGAPVTLQVTGYTDLSGSAGYNQRLSVRRANAVANALARFGVPRNDMEITGRGMNNPRVPTAPGVREPQNRRVEIVFP